MQYEFVIKTAKVFLEDFYTAVTARKPIDWATQAARNAISQELGLDNRGFATLVLYMRAEDGEVFWIFSQNIKVYQVEHFHYVWYEMAYP